MWNEFLPISMPITAGEASSFCDMTCSLSSVARASMRILIAKLPLEDGVCDECVMEFWHHSIAPLLPRSWRRPPTKRTGHRLSASPHDHLYRKSPARDVD